LPQGANYEELDYRTLCDAVCAKIRDEILSGALKPGVRLQQTELAERFGISRMPVRDALRKLEAEGLVTVYPGRGAVGATLDLDELRDIYQIRFILEEAAARMSAAAVTSEDMVELTELVYKMEEACRKGDLGAWLELDRKFHMTSYRHCRNSRLLDTIDSIWNATQHFRRAYCTLPGGMQKAHDEHRRIIAGLEKKDSETFAALVREHLQETLDGIMQVQTGQPGEAMR